MKKITLFLLQISVVQKIKGNNIPSFRYQPNGENITEPNFGYQLWSYQNYKPFVAGSMKF